MSKKHGDESFWDNWFWQDYNSNFALRACSLAAQGLWARMVYIMTKSKRKGYLLDGEQPMEDKILARIVGITEWEIVPLLDELNRHGVFSWMEAEESGFDRPVIYYPRMVQEAERLSKLSETKGKDKNATRKNSTKKY